MGTHFKTGWESKGTAVPLARGHPIGAGSALLAGESKGDSVPLAVVSKGGGAALAGGIQGGQSLPGGKNPMKPAVSWHTTLLTKSSVLYVWRPWVAERDCSGREQALSVSHRTGGFCVLPDEKLRSLPIKCSRDGNLLLRRNPNQENPFYMISALRTLKRNTKHSDMSSFLLNRYML